MERRPPLALRALELVLDMLRVPETELVPEVAVTCAGSSRVSHELNPPGIGILQSSEPS